VKLSFGTRLWLAAAVVVALTTAASAVYAHEGRHVGEYEFVVGFSVEPALEGWKNGVDLRVTGHTHEQEHQAMPVEGLEGTLQVAVTHVPTGASKVFKLQPVFGEPGHYKADLIPTAPGQYRFRFLGTVEGVEVDEVFESGPGRFSDIESAGDLHFPEKLPAVREIEGAARGAQSMAEQAADTANSVRTLALLGMVLGVLGIASGAAATAMALRSR